MTKHNWLGLSMFAIVTCVGIGHGDLLKVRSADTTNLVQHQGDIHSQPVHQIVFDASQGNDSICDGAGDNDARKKKVEPAKTDITAAVREMNSAKFSAPTTKFRPGHVQASQFDAKAIWKTETGFTVQLPGNAPIPTPTVYKGKLYVSGGFSTREFYCFDAITGQCEWRMNLNDDGPTSAVCSDGIVVFNTESCTIFALDATTGKNLWSWYLGDPLMSTPTIANGKVFTSYPALARGNMAPPNAAHVLICLELKTGRIVWQKWIDSDVMTAPVAVDGELYATSFTGTVYKFNQNDGAILSAHSKRATSAPVIVANKVYWTQRADRGPNDKVAEEIVAIDRKLETQTFAGAKREAVYLDGRAQDKTILKEQGAKLDAGNGLGGMAIMMAGGKQFAAPYAGQMMGSQAQAGMAGMGGGTGMMGGGMMGMGSGMGVMGGTPAMGVAWEHIGLANVFSMQAFQGSRILHCNDTLFNCMGDELLSTDPKGGKVRWKLKIKGDLTKQGGHLAAPPASAGGRIFLATVEGNVLQVNPDTGVVMKTYKVGSPLRSQPAIDGGRIYVGTQDGKIVCINTGDARFTGWATCGANMAHTNTVEASSKSLSHR